MLKIKNTKIFKNKVVIITIIGLFIIKSLPGIKNVNIVI